MSEMKLLGCLAATTRWVAAAGADYLEVSMRAPEGPLGTSDYHIALQATPLAPGKTFLHFSYEYALGLAARLASLLAFKSRARLPEWLDPPRQRVRWRPLRYARARAQAALGADQRVSLTKGVATMVQAELRD